MSSPELERLADLGHLKRERPGRAEFVGLVHSAEVRLADARRMELSRESRFDLAYNAAHALALAALRWHGYRADKRYFVFQALPHTLEARAPTWRLLVKCHQERNQAEYEGLGEIDETLLAGLIEAVGWLLSKARGLPPPAESEG
ncbi:MAG TPA: hypothetical protein VF530_07660 [Planctomycetota bacterium]